LNGRAPTPAQRGDWLLAQGRHLEAGQCYAAALASQPDDAIARCKLGLCLRATRRFEEALQQFDLALARLPGLSMAHMDRGNVLADLRRPAEALAGYERALALDPANGLAHCNRAIALRDLGRLDECLAAFDAALSFGAPRHVVLANRGAALTELRRFDEALRDFNQAISAEPQFALAHWNESLCRLVRGELREGWMKYEWRWRYGELGLVPREFAQPMWRGQSDLSGLRLLVHAEQGLGDTLQFCRYVPLLAQRGARVALQVPVELKTLMRTLPGVDRLESESDPLPPFDLHVPMMSLPLAFETSLATIPSQVPYLRADPRQELAWAARLGPRDRRPRIGLAWSGRPEHSNDRNRSIPLEQIGRLIDKRFDWISLQKEVRAFDRAALARLPLLDVSAGLDDLAATAALMMNLDLVISVDTAAAHLAGALGRPLWLLLPFAPDWRWMLERADSPWYPSARLIRQDAIGNWSGVIHTLTDALACYERPAADTGRGLPHQALEICIR